ncbi:MAG: hypothetical protein PF482_19990 [Desulfobacteraceae bacterium]|jgi:hypothetical protein|nr:hypothetical protein [Desulfobacteraceae bacterium]
MILNSCSNVYLHSNHAKINILEFDDQKGHRHRYEWFNGVPLNGSKQADNVNFFEYTAIVDGKVSFYGSWVTDIPVDQVNVQMRVKGCTPDGKLKTKISIL